MEQFKSQEVINYQQLAQTFSVNIKETVVKRFTVEMKDLVILFEDKNGVYLSKEEPGTLCCFILDNKNGSLYLVTAKITENGKVLSEFKTDIVS